MILTLLLALSAGATELEATYDPVLGMDSTPALRFTSLHFPAAVLVECEVGGQTLSWEFEEVAAGEPYSVELPRSPAITSASCQVLARFANGHSQGVDVEMSWTYRELDQRGDGGQASLDIEARVATMPMPFPAIKATVWALDSRGDPIFEEQLTLSPRSRRATVRWSEAGAERSSVMRFELEGEHGETVTYDIKVQRRQR